MAMTTRFTEHPASVGETYGEHFKVASRFAVQLFGAAAACALHAVFPNCCTTTGSSKVKQLHAEMTSGARAHLGENPALQSA